MDKPCVVFWFRQDLRLADNPAFCAAVKAGTVLPIYILDDVNSGRAKMGAASRVWLHHSLHSLNRALGSKLSVLSGDARTVIMALTKKEKI